MDPERITLDSIDTVLPTIDDCALVPTRWLESWREDVRRLQDENTELRERLSTAREREHAEIGKVGRLLADLLAARDRETALIAAGDAMAKWSRVAQAHVWRALVDEISKRDLGRSVVGQSGETE